MNIEIFFADDYWWIRVPTRNNTTTAVYGCFDTAGAAVDYAINTYACYIVRVRIEH